jgi:hypothetical protein
MLNNAKTNGNNITESMGTDADGNPLPSLLDSLTNAQESAKAVNQTIAAIKDPSLAANAARGELNAVGGAGVTNNPQGSTQQQDQFRYDAQGRKWKLGPNGTPVPAQ